MCLRDGDAERRIMMTRENGSAALVSSVDGTLTDDTGSLLTTPGDTVPDAKSPVAIARVASPVRNEATSVRFYGWAARGRIIEKTQLVWTSSKIGSQTIRFFGVIEEVFRR